MYWSGCDRRKDGGLGPSVGRGCDRRKDHGGIEDTELLYIRDVVRESMGKNEAPCGHLMITTVLFIPSLI